VVQDSVEDGMAGMRMEELRADLSRHPSSNAVNPQVRNLFHVGKNLFIVLFGSIIPPASLGNGHSSSNQ
jgi:hypothetical protein